MSIQHLSGSSSLNNHRPRSTLRNIYSFSVSVFVAMSTFLLKTLVLRRYRRRNMFAVNEYHCCCRVRCIRLWRVKPTLTALFFSCNTTLMQNEFLFIYQTALCEGTYFLLCIPFWIVVKLHLTFVLLCRTTSQRLV